MPSLSYVDLMSAGSSSQLAACFSVDRTKYLMLSKSMPDRSEPQFGIGLRWKYLRPFSRNSSIHSGSFLSPEMSRTTSSDNPRRADAPATSGSAQPNLYVPSPSSWSLAVVVMCQSPPDSSEFLVTRSVRSVHVTCVVQIPSPCAIVASRCTGVPSSLPNASVSASHSCGNSAATCATGQWCWQICSPLPVAPRVPIAGAGPADAAYPSADSASA